MHTSLSRAALTGIKRDLRHSGLPANDVLARRIFMAHQASGGTKLPVVDTTGLNLPSRATPLLLGRMGMGGMVENRLGGQEIHTCFLIMDKNRSETSSYESNKALELALEKKEKAALMFIQRVRHRYIKITGLLLIAYVMKRNRGVEKAYEVVAEALEIVPKLRHGVPMATSLVKAAVTLDQIGKADEASARFKEALEIVRAINANNVKADMLFRISSVMTRLQRTDQAIEVAREIEICKREKTSALVSVAQRLGMEGKTEEAFKVLREAHAAAQEGTKDHKITLEALDKVANGMIEIGERGEAHKVLEEALEIARKSSNIFKLISGTDRIRLEFDQQELQRQNEELKRQRMAEEEEILQNLNSEDLAVRQDALGQYLKRNMQETRFTPRIDELIVEMIEADKDKAEEFKRIVEENDLPLSCALIEKIEQEEAFREALGGKIEEITQDIYNKICEALGMEARHKATASAGNSGDYGSISFSLGLRLELRPTIELRQELLPSNALEVESGSSIEEMKERIRVLNFLVHHEVGHKIQEERKIRWPMIGAYPALDIEKAKHHANEIRVDKLALEAARKTYVHGDGDIIFTEAIREAIAIDAFLTLGKIVLRNISAGIHDLSEENIARIVAGLKEMAKSQAISAEMKRDLSELAGIFLQRIESEKDKEKNLQIYSLIRIYREIFRRTNLN